MEAKHYRADEVSFARRSLMEMLPNEIPDAALKALRRHVQRAQMGLHEYKCAICGKVFEARTEYSYKLRYKNKTTYYCCHKHMRMHEAPMIEREKQAILNRWTDRSCNMTERARVEAEVYRCRKKLEEWEARTKTPEYETMHWRKRGQINGNVVKWRTKLLMAEERLEELSKA